MAGESGFTRSIMDEVYFWDIQRHQMEGESGVIRSIIDELDSYDIQGDQVEAESMVLLKVASMNLILGISNKIK